MEEQQRKTTVKFCFIVMIFMLIAAILCVVLPIVLSKDGEIVGIPLLQMLGFLLVGLVTGGFAHKLSNKNGAKWEKVIHFLTYIPYAFAFIIILLLFALYKAAKQGAQEHEKIRKITITYEGKEIELEYDSGGNYYKDYKGLNDHPYYGKPYLRYVQWDMFAYYWLSFDGGKTFVKEEEFNPFTYKN